jgi:phage terminase large subunit
MITLEISPSRFNPVYLKRMMGNDRRLQIYYGGSSSGKSVAVAQRAVLDIFGGQRNYLVVRNVQKTLRQS